MAMQRERQAWTQTPQFMCPVSVMMMVVVVMMMTGMMMVTVMISQEQRSEG